MNMNQKQHTEQQHTEQQHTEQQHTEQPCIRLNVDYTMPVQNSRAIMSNNVIPRSHTTYKVTSIRILKWYLRKDSTLMYTHESVETISGEQITKGQYDLWKQRDESWKYYTLADIMYYSDKELKTWDSSQWKTEYNVPFGVSSETRGFHKLKTILFIYRETNMKKGVHTNATHKYVRFDPRGKHKQTRKNRVSGTVSKLST